MTVASSFGLYDTIVTVIIMLPIPSQQRHETMPDITRVADGKLQVYSCRQLLYAGVIDECGSACQLLAVCVDLPTACTAGSKQLVLQAPVFAGLPAVSTQHGLPSILSACLPGGLQQPLKSLLLRTKLQLYSTIHLNRGCCNCLRLLHH
jgi:hypothetical protein